jgi:hypothetical protein
MNMNELKRLSNLPAYSYPWMARLFYIAILSFSLISVPALAQVHDPKAFYADPKVAKGPIAPLLTGLATDRYCQ